MSRAFVREQDVDHRDDMPERPVSEHPNDVTAEGLAAIDGALSTARYAMAAAQALQDQAAVAVAGRDLRYWNARRSTARVVPNHGDDSLVRFGSTVTITRDDGREQTFRIVGEDEADPRRGTISHVSPLAQSMLGNRVGDVITAGEREAEIIHIF